VLDRKEIEEVVGVKKATAKKKKPIPADSTETPVREKSTEKKKVPLDKLKLATNDAGAE
jgi:hypothetical protein